MAREIDFAYEGMELLAEYKLDIRGRSGVPGVPQYFKEVTGTIRVATEETEERLRQAAEMADSRCPMYNLMLAAGVDIRIAWERAS